MREDGPKKDLLGLRNYHSTEMSEDKTSLKKEDKKVLFDPELGRKQKKIREKEKKTVHESKLRGKKSYLKM